MLTTFSSRTTRAILFAAALLILALPAIATSDAWTWEDRSGLLPWRDGASINLVSERQNTWLASDGLHLYKFNGSALQDLTGTARGRGLLGISSIFSDDQTWLLSYRPLDRREPSLWFTDGQTWTDATGKFFDGEGGVDAVGRNGQWYVRTYTKATNGKPASWTLYSLNGIQSTPLRVEPPAGLNPLQAGCFNDIDGSKLCTGVSTPFFLNGQSFIIGGSSQSKGPTDVVTQKSRSGIWTLREKIWTPVPVPAFSFVSGVWPGGNGTILIATSEAQTNPFAADHLWIFDGVDLRDASEAALSHGLLSVDAREIRAAWNGRAWVLLIGKKLIRFDGVHMTDEGTTRDAFSALAGNDSGLVVLGGAVSNPQQTFATEPLTAKLVTLEEDQSADITPPPGVVPVASEIISKLFGPRVNVTTNPVNARIGNGKLFTFTVTAEDAGGLERVDLYVHGARIKSCPGNTCSYTQTYWTNGLPMRQLEMFARAINTKGYANESARTTLTVDTALNTSLDPIVISSWQPPVTPPTPPSPLVWTTDKGTGIAWASRFNPDERKLKTGGAITYEVTARAPQSGLTRTEIWVNGQVKNICSFNRAKDNQTCRLTLNANEYPSNTDVFVNARIQNTRTEETWTTGTTLHREETPVVASVVNTPVSPVIAIPPVIPAATVVAPVFSSTATLQPNVSAAVRGTGLTFRSLSQNNISGLDRVEIFVNGAIQRTCTFGTAMSPVPCETVIDTTSRQPGTTITFMAKAVDNNGKETWSNAKSVLLLAMTAGASSNEAPAKAVNGLSLWSWIAPVVSEISVNQTVTYTVGAWSPSGLRAIEIIADGTVRQNCAFGGAKGSKECAYTFSAQDFSDGHTVTVNARVTDGAGTISWSDARMVTTKHGWGPTSDPLAYANISSDAKDGYVAGQRLNFQARGWSPRGAERLDVFVNGLQVASCPTDTCSWTSQPYDRPVVEYQARLIDRLQQETWTGVYGLYQK